MITLEPTNGLCNRLRAIDGALALARQVSTGLRIVWARTDACGAPFSAIFDPLPGASVVERGLWSNRLLRRVELYSGRHTRAIREREMGHLLATGYDFTALAGEPSTFIQTYGRFFSSARPFAAFVPVAPLAAEVDRLTSAFSAPTLGVHVRRTDNARAIAHSPTSDFVERMERELTANPDTRFYLATDSPEVEAELRHAFPGRIVVRAKAFERTSIAGIRDAVVDLYCLARTRRVIGSYFSSFSHTAAEIGGLPLEIIDRPPVS
jgi:hypothetical protein